VGVPRRAIGYEWAMSEAQGPGVPVCWLVGRRGLGLTVLTGEVGLNRPIAWAHSIELADPAPRAGEVPILNVAAAIACAVADATGAPVDRIPLTPPAVCALLDDRDPVRLAHIAPDWRANVLTAAG
jgi:hypothetical protein